MKLELFEPALCCESGVCGPEPDNKLLNLQNTILLLKKAGIETQRYAINQAPLAFVHNPLVSSFIKSNGVKQLPLVVLDGVIIKSGGYPTIDDLVVHIPLLKEIKPDSHILGIF